MNPVYTFSSPKDSQFPPMVQLTINNRCQLDCFHCPQQVYAHSSYNDDSQMSLALFRKITDEMRAYHHTTLRIFARGEPLLHPNIVEMIRIAKQESNLPVVSVITNGIALRGAIAEGFIRYGLDLVEVSLDALTEETYRQVRPLVGQVRDERSSPFNRVIENIQNYIVMRDQRNQKCKIVVSIIDQPLAHHEVDAFIERWEKQVDQVLKRKFHSFQGRVSGIPLPEKRHPCRVLWSRFNIHANGNVSICYNDWKNEEVIGNLNDPETTIAALWQHPTYERYRQLQQQLNFPGVCARCQDWTGASWTTPYENVFTNVLSKSEEIYDHASLF